jgi:hypothetical protein
VDQAGQPGRPGPAETLANLSALPAEAVSAIEAKLAARHLGPEADPPRMALFDLSSSWLEGRCCPLAARGYSRDGKKGKLQIEYGLLTDPEGRPVAVRVLPGNTGDPAAFTEIVQVMRGKFGLEQMVMVGDRGMITSARIDALREADDGYGWITALRAPAIRKLMADGGPLQMSLFDQQNLAEITSPDYPGERLIACRNPVLAADRARTREELLAATGRLLAPIIARVQAGRLAGAGEIGVAAGKVISKYKTGKHFAIAITDTSLAVTRRQAQIEEEAALDGFYVLRTPVPASQLDAPAWSPPTRTSNTSNATSATSRPTTWTCARSSTTSKNSSKPRTPPSPGEQTQARTRIAYPISRNFGLEASLRPSSASQPNTRTMSR